MVVLEVLRALREAGIASPGDLVASTGMPRYLVLSAFRCLEELGLVERVYAKGTHRAYRVSSLGLRILDAGLVALSDVIELGIEAIAEKAVAPAGNLAANAEEAV